MPEEENGTLQATDVFQTQEKIMAQLVDVLKDRGAGQPQQVIYAQPATKPAQQAPNYLLYIGIAAVAVLFLRKK